MFSFLTFPTFNFSFHLLLLYSVFGKHKLGSSVIDQIGNTAFTAEFFTVANTLKEYNLERKVLSAIIC